MMVIATDGVSRNEADEQRADTREEASVNTNPPSLNEKDQHLLLPNTNNGDGITTVSIGVGQDADSEDNTTITDEYKYTGDLYAEKKHGKGVLSWSDGRMYTGAFFADKRHGFGIDRTPDTSEFKGLFCHDERFGPGILFYKSLGSADVGLWSSESLIRLLHPHPNLSFDIQITDKKSSHSSSTLIPSWYSPQELLSSAFGWNFLMKKKPSMYFCTHIREQNSSINDYIYEHLDRMKETMHEKHAQIDAYLSSIDGKRSEKYLQDQMSRERKAEIRSPNETSEQQQLFNYVNKFWPLKQRALFPIDEILSNTRSSFPNPGPLERASLNLFESSFNGQEHEVRELLLQKLVYIDVCDSHGLTALHFSTYNAHINVINTLLDFGGNVNQLSDDGVTPLGLAFLLYYGNTPDQTMNTALEHTDPIVLNPRTPIFIEPTTSLILSKQNVTESSSYLTNDSTITDELKLPSSFESMRITDSDQKNAYGFELTERLRLRIRDVQFRESIYAVIELLLRRGADPSFSDWPLPVFAFAVRAEDKPMIELLLKKKVKVNCQLDPARNASLTPLHIACGCSFPGAIDIARLLLENSADVNAQSLAGNKEYLSLIDPLIVNPNKMNDVQQNGRTPLHIACTRDDALNTLDLVRLLLRYKANPNVVCNGQTPLSLAIILGNEALVNLLLDYETTDPSTPLGLGNGNALCMLLSTFYESRWTYAKRLKLIERLIAKSPQVFFPIRFGPKNSLGSAIDFAHFMFNADQRISQTPFHSLTSQERVIFGQRQELLTYMAKRFREEASKYEEMLRIPTPISELRTQTSTSTNMFSRNASLQKEKSLDQAKFSGDFRYCATCGRSAGVRLNVCKRCQKVFFCSKTCKIQGWYQFHRYECRQVSSPIATMPTSSSRLNKESLTDSDRILTLKTPPKPSNKARLPPLSVAKLLREKRIKNRKKLAAKSAATLSGIQLSWNPTYNAPENYSFN